MTYCLIRLTIVLITKVIGLMISATLIAAQIAGLIQISIIMDIVELTQIKMVMRIMEWI